MKTPSHVVELETDDSYIPECAVWYSVGVLVILLRFATRLRTVGLAGFRGDDYLAFLYLALYTACIAIVVVTYHTGSLLEVTDANVDLLTDDDVVILRRGSQIEYASFFIYSGCIWALKFSVLFFYNRITLGVLRRKTIIFLFWLCGLSYTVLCLIALLSCRPFSANWQVKPRPGPECTYRPQNFWSLVVLNVATDAALLSIPVPLLWRLRVRPLRKFGVALLLSSGIFVMSTAIVRAWSTLTGPASVVKINRWGFRELGVGLVAVAAPVIYPLFRPAFWARGPYLPPDRRRQLLLLHQPQPQPPPGGSSSPRAAHDTAIELHEIDELVTALPLFQDNDDDDDDGAARPKDVEKGPAPKPMPHPRRTVSTSTTVVASEAGSLRQPSVRRADYPADAVTRVPSCASGATAVPAEIEETDWALQYMPK